MTDKRLLLALPVLALLAGCDGNSAGSDGRAASGEVLEGTISDEMVPVDRVRSEPPLEDPDAFAKARSAADGASGPSQAAGSEDGSEREQPDAEVTQPPTPDVPPVE